MLDKSVPFIGVLMTKTDTFCYPRYALPEGFTFCGYHPGMEHAWAELMFSVEQTDTLEQAKDIFQREFLTSPLLLPEQCLFVLDSQGNTAAAASLWYGNHFGKVLPRIHWVAAVPEYQGRGLVKALLTRLMDAYDDKENGGFLYLTTQTWSYKAINLYSKFGFQSYMGEKPENWRSENFTEENERAWEIIRQKIKENDKHY